MPAALMPAGPEFQAADQFRPLELPKDYDLIYVAAARAYKRHDILLDAFERLPRDVRGLCVFGYGADALRARIAERGLSIHCMARPAYRSTRCRRCPQPLRQDVAAQKSNATLTNIIGLAAVAVHRRASIWRIACTVPLCLPLPKPRRRPCRR